MIEERVVTDTSLFRGRLGGLQVTGEKTGGDWSGHSQVSGQVGGVKAREWWLVFEAQEQEQRVSKSAGDSRGWSCQVHRVGGAEAERRLRAGGRGACRAASLWVLLSSVSVLTQPHKTPQNSVA